MPEAVGDTRCSRSWGRLWIETRSTPLGVALALVAAGHGAGCGLKRVRRGRVAERVVVAAGHGAGCGLKPLPPFQAVCGCGCSRSSGRLWIETRGPAACRRRNRVAAGHGAGCGLKPLRGGDRPALRWLQPVMGPAVD